MRNENDDRLKSYSPISNDWSQTYLRVQGPGSGAVVWALGPLVDERLDEGALGGVVDGDEVAALGRALVRGHREGELVDLGHVAVVAVLLPARLATLVVIWKYCNLRAMVFYPISTLEMQISRFHFNRGPLKRKLHESKNTNWQGCEKQYLFRLFQY